MVATKIHPNHISHHLRTGWRGLIEEYKNYLPVTPETPIITLREGNTPLIPVPTISKMIGRGVKVFVKYDGLNPTGSFKDRGMTMAISKAKEAGAKAVICASTGNTSAAAAAYATRAGMKAFVIIPDGYVALGKLAQALIYGAEVLAIEGNFDHALTIVRQIADNYPVTLVNSVNPYRLEGQKTAAFEVVDWLGNAPDWLCIPVGNAGNISAYWMGFCEYHQIGKGDRLPKMMGFQAAGAAPFITGQPVANRAKNCHRPNQVKQRGRHEAAHEAARFSFAAASEPFFEPRAHALQAVFDAPPLAENRAHNERAQHNQFVFGLQEHLQPNSSREQAHARNHGFFEFSRKARPEQQPGGAPDQDGNNVDNGSGHGSLASLVACPFD